MPPKVDAALATTPKSKPQNQPKKKAKAKTIPDPHWRKRGRAGKRALLRAVQHRILNSCEAFKTLGDDPDAKVSKLKRYPSDEFLHGGERFMVSRYCNFLLQSVLILARVFQVPKIMKHTFGEGAMTSARVALFFCRTTEMTNLDALNIRSLKRSIYARMLTEAESREAVEATLKGEWEQDRESSVNLRIDEWLPTHLAAKVAEGRYPLTNLTFDVDAQWEHVWEDRSDDVCVCGVL